MRVSAGVPSRSRGRATRMTLVPCTLHAQHHGRICKSIGDSETALLAQQIEPHIPPTPPVHDVPAAGEEG